MKLDHECVRSILLFVEKTHHPGSFISLEQLHKASDLQEYDPDEIDYAILKLCEANYLEGKPNIISGRLIEFGCGGLTWDGHEYLDTIRDPKIWRQIKDKIAKFESVPLSVVSALGASLLKHALGL